MIYKSTIGISKKDVDFVQKYMGFISYTDSLDEETGLPKDSLILSWTTKFEDDCFADINFCSGTANFFIDNILFNKNGREVCVLDCADDLIGDFEFEYNGNIYIVTTEQEK